MVGALARRRAVRDAAQTAYRRVVEQARQPAFYRRFGVPDTTMGRYELVCLHAFLYLHRLKSERPQSAPLSQAFFDTMFADIDRGLREIGVGDLSVGRHVKHLARGFYGRIRAYEWGLAGGDPELSQALMRNLFATVGEPSRGAAAITGYIRRSVATLRDQPLAELLAGEARFADPAASEAEPVTTTAADRR
jgi:cytochrome b pre-mRNA-processing protein 3